MRRDVVLQLIARQAPHVFLGPQDSPAEPATLEGNLVQVVQDHLPPRRVRPVVTERADQTKTQ